MEGGEGHSVQRTQLTQRLRQARAWLMAMALLTGGARGGLGGSVQSGAPRGRNP